MTDREFDMLTMLPIDDDGLKRNSNAVAALTGEQSAALTCPPTHVTARVVVLRTNSVR